MTKLKETIVIAMGGSLLVPDNIDVNFVKELRVMLGHVISEGYQIALVIGGGKTSRYYSQAASEFDHLSHEDLDWIGIKTIHLNCEFMFRVCSDFDIHPKVILKHQDIRNIKESLIIVGAWQPGHSSDYNAVSMAEVLGAERVINFSNTSHVYSADPHIDTKAQKIKTLSWSEYRSLIPQVWTPNMSAPFDPIASKKAEDLAMTVVVLGASLENLNAYLTGRDFEGSVIS